MFIGTKDVEGITDQLGIRVLARNAATTIKTNNKYFAADGVRSKGGLIRYKINRKGIDELEKIIAV